MKISVSTLALSPAPLNDILTYLEDENVEYCEVINEYPYHKIERDIVDSYNIKITVHSPLSDVNIASYNDTMRNSSISQIKNSIDIAAKLEPGLVVVHPGQIPILGKKFEEKILKQCIESLNECSIYAKENDVLMCVENMPDIEGLLLKDIKDLHEVADEIDSYITLDVGHAYNMNFDVSEMFKSPKIRHIHLSDNDGSFDTHNALGSGDINFEYLFNELKKIDYDGVVVIEVKDTPSVAKSLDFIRNRLSIT